MTGKEFFSLAMTMVVLLLSMLTGYILLALIYEGSPLLVALVGLAVLLVSCFLVVYLFKMRKLIDTGKEKEDKDEDKTKR
ncbi:MAG TPA: hypothetical protein VJ854_02890 [Sphaerochaeta sp.]|nr:hypothetical protein [Sphaerochaeta sp.]